MGPKEKQLRDLVKSKGLNYVGHRGNTKAPICIIGEAPGADEDACGLPFMGQAGKQLEGQLEEVGITDVWYTNPYHVRPPGNDLDSYGVFGIPRELEFDVLVENLNEHKPNFIVTAGATPTTILCPDTVNPKTGKTPIGSFKGSLLQSNLLRWPHYVVPMPHPAYILRAYDERVFSLFCLDRVKEELAFFQRHLHLQPLPQRELLDDPSYGDCISYLNDCLVSKERISHDIENPFYKRSKIPYVFNFALSAKSAISFNLFDFDPPQLVTLWRLMDEVLRTKKLIGQNYINFDAVYQEESVGLRPNIQGIDDTMTRHKVLWPEFPHKLEFQTFQYTREPYYKDEGKQWNPREGRRRLRNYGAKDAAVTYDIWEQQELELDKRGLREFYETIEAPLARNFHWIEKRGVYVDETKLGNLRNKIKHYLERICNEATPLVGKATFAAKPEADAFKKFAKKAGKEIEVFNLGSPKQIAEEFARLGIYLPSEDGKIKTDEEALQKSIAKTGHKLPALILQSRGLSKLKGTYVEAKLKDGALFTSYITTGTVNGRRSSSGYFSDTPFEYGTNMQNLPSHGKGIINEFHQDYRECLVARPGKIFLSCDQASAEDWIVQGIIKDQGGSPRGFEELLAGIDRHRKLASFVFKKPEALCGKESHERYLGKKTRHAGNYDMQAFRFAVVLAKEGFHTPEFCPKCHGKRNRCSQCVVNTTDLLVSFHAYDPGIKGIFHKYVQHKLETTRTLTNPFGRQRIFFGLHPFRDNTKIFKEAYSTLPQSTVSDNTAQAINIIEAKRPGWLIKDDHDAVTLEVDDNPTEISNGIDLLKLAFDRKITLENGLTFVIPIENEIGYNLKNKKKVTKENFLEVRDNLLAKVG